jgi:GT2 family glycosyltransferase
MFQLISVPTHPAVSVIILNYNGLAFLPRCLETLRRTTYSPLELVVVDNNSTDGSLSYLHEHHPDIRIIAFKENLGYSGAYNAAIEQISNELLVLLNFDVEVEADWLDPAIEILQSDAEVVAVQPKLRSLQRPDCFEYAGGSGGFIDRYGYPFARGRVFDDLETDRGQYNDARCIFWASGAALITRKSAYLAAGQLDADFFLHMEELDLCWRYWLLGWKVMVAPSGVVYHYSGAALSADRFHKMYYNHRNGLAMMIKNYSLCNLLRRLPVRVFWDGITALMALFKRQPKRSLAVLAAYGHLLVHSGRLLAKRRQVQRMRKVPDSRLGDVVFPGSVVWRYFVKGQKTYSQLLAGR